MINEKQLHFRRGDAAVIIVTLLLAVCLILMMTVFQPSGKMKTAKVYKEGRLICELDLSRDTEIVVEGKYRNVITVRGGAVAVTESSCPGKDCLRPGFISAGGRSIVCLPNRVEILLSGESDVDAFTQ